MTTDLRSKYQELASSELSKNYSFFLEGHSYAIDSSSMDHLISLGVSVMLTRDKLLPGGSFVQAVVRNDLGDAIGRADKIAFIGLKYFIHLRDFIHIS